MFGRLLRISSFVLSFVHSKVNPNGYARRVGVVMGDNVHFYGMRPAMFSTEPWLITLGDDVHVTSGCQFITHDGGTLVLRHRDPTLEITAPIKVGSRVYLGMQTIILPGVTIGDDVVIGARSVVTRDIPSNSVAVGTPARVIKSLDQYFDELSERSLGLGHLTGKQKDAALRRHFDGLR